jgi:hypothetical protein
MAGVAKGDEIASFGQATPAVGADVVDMQLDIDIIGGAATTDPTPEVVTAKHLHPQFLARRMSEAGPLNSFKRL